MLLITMLCGCGKSAAQTSTDISAAATPSVTPTDTPTAEPTQQPTPSPAPNGFEAYPADISLNGYANRGFSIADGAIVYISNPYCSDICAIDVQTGKISKVGVTCDQTNFVGPEDIICLYDGYIYFTSNGYDFINECNTVGMARIRADGTGEETVFTPEGIDVDTYSQFCLWNCAACGQYILYNYCIDDSPITFQIDMVTGESTQLKSLPTKHIASDGEYFYCDLIIDVYDPSSLCRAKMGSGGIKAKTVVTGAMPELIVPVDDWIYYTSYATNPEKICRVKKDGSDLQELGATAWQSQFNVAGDYVYYTDPEDGRRLYRMDTDGTGKEKICDIGNILKISISAGRVFLEYTENDDGGDIYFASVLPDGSGLIDLTKMLEEA